LPPAGLAVLGAPVDELPDLRQRALERGLDVIDFPRFGQLTNDYGEFCRLVQVTEPAELEYVGIAVHGAARDVRSITGRLPLLR